ncbi:lipopolysaccharide heptosyltransferase II [Planctomycetota bacterium]
MDDKKKKIIIWLASPMGDAILSTPALRAIRKHFSSARIYFFAKPLIRQILSPGNFNDHWLDKTCDNPFKIAGMLKQHKFTHAILLKNSFASALAVFLAKIPIRIGYAREGRALLLNQKLYPPKLTNGSFKPVSALDYYLAIASWLGGDVSQRDTELQLDPQAKHSLNAKLPQSDKPSVILVPGGAFGPSKCWPSQRFAKVADWLIENYNAEIFVSVSPDQAEITIANEICQAGKHELINLGQKQLTIAELKSLFSRASLVISNDTGPRHIAIALKRKIVTLFGPNNPAWTENGYEDEIKIIGTGPCVPCDKPKCKKDQHICMDSITVEMVVQAAKKLLDKNNCQENL